MNLRDIIFSGDTFGLQNALRANPLLVNDEISLPDNPAKAHVLHRVCDAVFFGKITEEKAVELAKILFDHGANVNPAKQPGEDSPLTAAASLHCDQLALLYIAHGAHIDHQGCSGGTALHWASWCGRDVIVEKLAPLTKDINRLCIEFKSTPLFWAAHGFRFGDEGNRHHQLNCARILMQHGADPTIPNLDGTPAEKLVGDDEEWREVLRRGK